MANARSMVVVVVNSTNSIIAFLDCLEDLSSTPPSLYCDLEGIKLSRHGSISIFQVFVPPKKCTFLIDVHVLGETAFITTNDSGLTFKSVLESASIAKVFFDVRNDADALYAHFGIGLQGVRDLQLMEVASRWSSKAVVFGLATCIEKDSGLRIVDKQSWKDLKQRGQALFSPEHGGSYEVFNIRPLRQDIMDYCTQDVVRLPTLYNVYSRRLSAAWARKVLTETEKRVAMAQSASYDPHSKNKVRSPWAGKNAKPIRPNEVLNLVPQTQKQNSNKSARQELKQDLISAAERVAIRVTDRKKEKTSKKAVQPIQGPSRPQASSNTGAQYLAGLSVSGPVSTPAPPTVTRNAMAPSSSPAVTVQNRPNSEWTCDICHRAMQKDQRGTHLSGKPHRNREKQALPGPGDVGSGGVPKVGEKKKQKKKKGPPKSSKSTSPALVQTFDALNLSGGNSGGTVLPQHLGLPYPPDYLYVPFSSGGRSSTYTNRGDYYNSVYESLDYNLCDKDCGWCGHCMDGIDVWDL